MQNLDKGIKMGTKFSLRSCLRIRAAYRGHHSMHPSSKEQGALSPSSSPSHPQQQGVTIRFEALMPDLSFHAVQIFALPLMGTPLTGQLTGTYHDSTGDRPVHSFGPSMGYLTMSATRQLVPLMQCDGGASGGVMSTPVVGVWVSMPELCVEGSGDGSMSSCLHEASGRQATSMLNNPYIWGSCVWYVKNENILERVWEEPNLFLLVSWRVDST